jgi:glycopeptide antibiotics resistance protein
VSARDETGAGDAGADGRARRSDGIMAHSSEFRRPLLLAGLIYAAGIVYGSLIPFRLRQMTWAEAWADFQNIPFLDLGAGSRADWVANLIIYMPLAFVLMAALWSRHSRILRVLATQAVLMFCFALAIGVEFVQEFFAPRTVSLNDLLAEGLGAALGVVVWWGFGERLVALAGDVFRSGPRALRAAFYLYLLAVVSLAVFPFDLVISGAELAERLARVGEGLFRVGAFHRSAVHGLASVAGQMAIFMPLGALLALTRPGVTPGAALRFGLGLGALLELVQVFIWSGVVTLAAAVFAGLGAAAGVLAVRAVAAVPPAALRRGLRLAVLAAIPVYLLALTVLNDLLGRGILSPDQILRDLSRVSFLPFYYHYFTTEVNAVASMLTRIAMYAPVGAMLWALRGAMPDTGGVKTAGLLAAALAGVMETGRLMVGLDPDPTNLLIAGAAGSGAFAALRLGMRWVSAPARPRRGARPASPQEEAEPPDAPASTPAHLAAAARAASAPALPAAAATAGEPAQEPAERPAGPPSPFDWRLLPLLAGLALVAAVLVGFPRFGWWLAAGLAGYAALLWVRPNWWLAALPAAIGAVDLAPWTGRFFVEEFDLLAAATLAVLIARRPPGGSDLPPLAGSRGMILALLALSYLIALDLPDLLAAPTDANAFNTYFSPFNGLRVAKGFLWALLLLPFLRQAQREAPEEAFRLLATGMGLGLAATSAWALAERLAFVGPFDFDTVIRVTGSFSSMHIGGGHLGAYLVMGLPFLAAPLAVRMPALARPAAFAAMALAGYVLLATFQRAAYAAFAVAAVVLVWGLLAAARRGGGRAGRVVAALVLALPVCGALVWAGLSGSFVESRFSTVGQDMEIREDNWLSGLAMRSPGLGTALFGEGLGSFPVTYLLRNADGVTTGSFAVLSEEGDRFLRLAPGLTQYFEQRLSAEGGGAHRLTVDVRSPTGGRFALFWCRKALLYSFTCQRTAFDLAPGEDWETLDWETAPPPRTARGPLAAGSPASLAMLTLDPGTVVDVDDVRLVGPGGAELIANGGFEQNTDRWFFSDDNHLAWRIKNQYLMVLFEQGWFGLAVFLAAVAAAAVRLMRAIGRGSSTAAVVLSGLAGFLALGVTESLLEAPRLGFLFYLLLFWGLARPRRSAEEVAAGRPPQALRMAERESLRPEFARSAPR